MRMSLGVKEDNIHTIGFLTDKTLAISSWARLLSHMESDVEIFLQKSD